MSDNSALVQRFVDTYNRGDTEAIVALVTPDVELETPGGLERGPEAAQRLAAKSTQDHALVHIEIERLVEAGDQVVVFAERQMRWRETGELADASPSDAVMTIRGGKVARWQRLRDAARRCGSPGWSRPSRLRAMARATSSRWREGVYPDHGRAWRAASPG